MEKVWTREGLGSVDTVLLDVPGIGLLVRGVALDYYDGILSFAAEDEHGGTWIATWLEKIQSDAPVVVNTGEVWLFARRPREMIDDAIAARIDWREPWATAPDEDLFRVRVVWPDTAEATPIPARAVLRELADPGVRHGGPPAAPLAG